MRQIIEDEPIKNVNKIMLAESRFGEADITRKTHSTALTFIEHQ